MTAKTLLMLVLMSHAFYLLLLVVRARLGNDSGFAFEGFLHLASSYTCLLWGPFVLVWQTLRGFVLDPLRLELRWGSDHTDSDTNPEKYGAGRTMRKVAPRVSVGTYAYVTFDREMNRQVTVANKIITVGWSKLGLTVVRTGLPVEDEEQPSWLTESTEDEVLTP